MDARGPENVITRAIENTPQDTLDKYGGKYNNKAGDRRLTTARDTYLLYK